MGISVRDDRRALFGRRGLTVVAPGEVPERSKGADCKSVGERLRRFESFPRHHYESPSVAAEPTLEVETGPKQDEVLSGNSSVG